ncbi:MAG: hypothetical protein KHW61_06120 [Clostridium sp.]|nr:hypothetical protein [Clostridium sp.]
MIHRQFAQRRRLMAGETVKTVTLTLTGSFDNSGLFGERYVAVDGEIITELGTYKVRQGSTIILHTKISPIMGGSGLLQTAQITARTTSIPSHATAR